MRRSFKLQWASKDLGQATKIALGDVNGDGIINIVAGTISDKGSSSLYVFRFSDKKYHELAKVSLGPDTTKCLKVFDIDRDGRDEIIVGTDRGICFYKMVGRKLVKISEITSLGEVLSIAIGDIDRDGSYEIVVSVRGRPHIYIIRYYKKRLVLVRQETFAHNVFCVAIGDTDGDGITELIVKTYNRRGCTIYVLTFINGAKREKWKGFFPGGGKNFLLVDDLDRDGKCEIIFHHGRKVKILKHQKRGYKVFWESPSFSQNPRDVAIYDIDGNGNKELVIVCLSNVYIFSWKGNKFIQEWTQTIPNGAICIDAGELNQKGYGEIVLGTIYGYIYVIEARRDRHRGKLWVGKIQTIVQDTVSIPIGKPDASRGVDAKARFSINEVKVLYDKVIVDGDVTAKILYVADLPSQPVHFFETTFSFLDFIHLYGAKPGMQALVYFNVEHVNVNVVSPRNVKVTILFEMLVKLVPFCFDPY